MVLEMLLKSGIMDYRTRSSLLAGFSWPLCSVPSTRKRKSLRYCFELIGIETLFGFLALRSRVG